MLADDAGLARGFQFLLERQAADGGWHSETYGALRGGAAITALVLDALAHGDDALRRLARPAAERAVARLMNGVRRRGCAACPDGTLDYPVYATALLLTADGRWNQLLAPQARETLRQYLVDSQVIARRAFPADSPHLGGWDMGGMPPPRAVTTGTNVSITAFVLEALAVASAETLDDRQRRGLDDAYSAAIAWLARCQTAANDGGFVYSPDPTSADNKAPRDGGDSNRPASYGTATCDGIRALTACGVRRDDERCQRALAWLRDHSTEQGIPGLLRSDWSRAMTYYYLSTLARVLSVIGDPEQVRRHRERIRRELAAEQKPDGSWSNPVSRMREDDPLIATSLAVVAWSRCT